MNDGSSLWQLSACELHNRYCDGDLIPDQVITACLKRINDVNPTLNAVVTLDREGGTTRGNRVDQPLATASTTGGLRRRANHSQRQPVCCRYPGDLG
jgi:Asp-tRNA(Asn)/Glu-tRNA(Gln) amidotransferase A subunit family amidase